MLNIIHVPHDGHEFPAELMESVCIPLESFFEYHKTMSDWKISSLINIEFRNRMIKFPISRLLCDVERFLENEEMEKFGMGFCYEKAYDGNVIKNVDSDLRRKSLVYYRRHHSLLKNTVQSATEDVSILDLHSFSERIVPKCNRMENRALPDICLGCGDQFLVDRLFGMFTDCGFYVAIDYPYSGSMMPFLDSWWMEKFHCHSVMVEVNKKMYLENRRTADMVSAVLSDYLHWVEEL